jgi:hypothetical protein
MAKKRAVRKSKSGFLMIPVRKNPSGRFTIRRNVAQGFVDSAGVFHPIRASFDYNPIRAGETKSLSAYARRKRKK